MILFLYIYIYIYIYIYKHAFVGKGICNSKSDIYRLNMLSWEREYATVK